MCVCVLSWVWFSFLETTGERHRHRKGLPQTGLCSYKCLEMGRKRSARITIVPGTTSKSKRKRLSCWEVNDLVEEEEKGEMPPRLEIQSNPCLPPYGKQLLEAVLSSQEARQTRPCPALVPFLVAGNGGCWSPNIWEWQFGWHCGDCSLFRKETEVLRLPW